MRRLQIPQNLGAKNFTYTKKCYVHKIAAIILSKIYFWQLRFKSQLNNLKWNSRKTVCFAYKIFYAKRSATSRLHMFLGNKLKWGSLCLDNVLIAEKEESSLIHEALAMLLRQNYSKIKRKYEFKFLRKSIWFIPTILLLGISDQQGKMLQIVE